MIVTTTLVLLASSTALAQDVRAGVEQLATQITKSAPEGQQQLRIAVADFPDLQGVTCDLGRFVASRLTTRLTQSRRFFVIERQRLSQVLAELKFSLSDVVDPTKAKQLGRMAGVEAIVVGSIADLGNQVDIDARVIEIETTRTIVGASATLSKDQVVTQMLGKGCQEPTVRIAGPSEPTVAVQTQNHGDIRFQLEGCGLSTGAVTCRFAVTNMGSKEVRQSISANNSTLYDDHGNNYKAAHVAFGNDSGRMADQILLPGIPVNAMLRINGVASSADRIALRLYVGRRNVLTFRDIVLEK